jgi:hypothetical protein
MSPVGCWGFAMLNLGPRKRVDLVYNPRLILAYLGFQNLLANVQFR